MFGIDRLDTQKAVTVLFYNMGGMDTEVSVVRYSAITEEKSNKTYEHVEVLGEAWDKQLGGEDLDLVLVNMLADRFNAMKERQGKADIRLNEKAMKRLQKDAVKMKDVLSANKQYNAKLIDLADYVSLITTVKRIEFEEQASGFFARIMAPVEEALKKAGVTMEDIDVVELLGGGIRVPKVQEILQKQLGKELSVHLNGDEAMCFGSAFIASNSSASFKVRKVYLTQHPVSQISIDIAPVDKSKARKQQAEQEEQMETKEEQENTEENTEESGEQNKTSNGITYERSMVLYKKSDFLGQRKTVSLTYDTNMKIDVYADNENGKREQLATFTLNSLDDIASNEVALKNGSSLPKVVLSFELSRSGLLQLNKAEAKIEEVVTYEEKPPKTKKNTTNNETDNGNTTE